MKERSKEEAQKRADQIDQFNSELKALEDDQVLQLSADQKASVSAYH